MRKRNTVLAFALALTMILSSASLAFAEVSQDVKGSSYEEAISELMDRGIVVGETDGLFHPDRPLTRAQACIMVVKAMNAPDAEVLGTPTQPVGKSGFKDMSGYGWAEGYINYAVKKGVVSGYPDGTFKAGNTVTMYELLSMVVRAAGYKAEDLEGSWPANFYSKAIELELLGLVPAPLPQNANRGMTATVVYSALEHIEKANPEPSKPGQGTDKDRPEGVPDTSAMTFAKASFNDTMTTYNGKDISKDVVVYTYGKSKDYSKTMEFSKKTSDYRLETVYKFKNVETSAFYTLENNKIVAMVVPMDVGFTGVIYGVLNGTVTSLNSDDQSVTGLETLTAGREITWLGTKGLTGIPASGAYLNGEVFEMRAKDGVVQSITTSGGVAAGKRFEEITSGYEEVDKYENGVVIIGGKAFEVKSNAAVYVIDKDNPKEYTVGRISNLRKGVEIRAYDISNDKEDSADIIVIKK